MGLFDKFKRSTGGMKIDDVTERIETNSERDNFINRIGTERFKSFCDNHFLKVEDLSISFLEKLANDLELFNFLDKKILLDIKVLNEGNLTLKYVYEKYEYDYLKYPILFNESDREKISLLNRDIKITGGNYVSISMDNFDLDNFKANKEYRQTVRSYFDDIDIVKNTTSGSVVRVNEVYSSSDINVLFGGMKYYFDSNDFSYFVSDKFKFDDSTIIVISFDKFINLSDEVVNRLKECNFILRDNMDKVIEFESKMNKDYDDAAMILNDGSDDKIVRFNHLLYVLNNCNLNDERKKYFSYYLKKYYFEDEYDYYLSGMISKLKGEVNLDDVKRLTESFNSLSYDDKIREVKMDNFDVSVFLGGIDLDKVNGSVLLNMINALGDNERSIVLSDEIVKSKLSNALFNSLDKTDDIRRYMEMLKHKLSVCEILSLIDVKRFNRLSNPTSYLVFSVLFENSDEDLNVVIGYLLQDNELFKAFFKESPKFYSALYGMDSELIKDVLFKLKENNMDNVCYSFIGCLSIDVQKYLIEEKLDDDLITILVPLFKKDAINYFFAYEKRANYLFSKFNIPLFISSGIVFNDEILKNDEFFDLLKSKSFVDFRKNINFVESKCYPDIIEKKLKKYYDEILSSYDMEKGIFKEYDMVINDLESFRRYSLFNSYILDDEAFEIFRKSRNGNDVNLDKLKELTSKKISEVVVDALFCDNIYNVWANIKEMFRFNDKLSPEDKVLDDDKVKFYKMILNFDNVSCEDKIKLYNELKDKNINLMFYEDLRMLKDKSYDLINKSLFNNTSCECDNELSNKYGVSVYDMRDREYFMLVRVEGHHRDKSGYRRGCYSIISNDNTSVYGDGDGVIYGYNSFDNDRVLHIFEEDSFSADAYEQFGSRERINRIMTPLEVTNGSSWYSEVQLVNLKDENMEDMYVAKRPDFVVVYDEPKGKDINESKALGIPIVIIRHKKLDVDKKVDIGVDDADFDEKNIYINNSYDEREIGKRRR